MDSPSNDAGRGYVDNNNNRHFNVVKVKAGIKLDSYRVFFCVILVIVEVQSASIRTVRFLSKKRTLLGRDPAIFLGGPEVIIIFINI